MSAPALKTELKTKALIKPEAKPFELIIIGGGPAGLSAGMYAKRYGIDTLLIEKAVLGGLITSTEMVENYPGFPEGISGIDLGGRFEEQAKKFGLDVVYGKALEIKKRGSVFTLRTEEHSYTTRSIIVATGSEPKKLGIKGEEELTGKGVSYCATCDGPFYKDKKVAVVGGGNGAIEEALFLTKFAKLVTVIHRRDSFRADKVLVDKASNNPKVFFLLSSEVEEIVGDDKVISIRVKDVTTKKITSIDMDGVFIYAGYGPNTGVVKGLVDLDENGTIITDEMLSSSVKGIFAAGDVRKKPLKQVVTSVADGAVAASSVKEFLAATHT